MKSHLSLLAALLIAAMSAPSDAQFFAPSNLSASFPPGGGPITLRTQFGYETTSLDIQSPSGGLIPVAEELGAAPFEFFLSNTPNQVTYGNAESLVNFDVGPTDLSVGVVGGTTDVLLEGATSVRERFPGPFATFPEGGGPISIAAEVELSTAGLDFQSPDGNLIPVPNEIGAAPFTFFLSNTPNQVTYGNLGGRVTFAAGSVTEMSVEARAGADDIQWFFGTGPGGGPIAGRFDTDNLVRELPEPATGSPLNVVICVLGLSVCRRSRSYRRMSQR